eukprot:12477398-Prorocentrum_lima.AAC.1
MAHLQLVDILPAIHKHTCQSDQKGSKKPKPEPIWAPLDAPVFPLNNVYDRKRNTRHDNKP